MRNHKKLIAVLTAAILVLSIGAVSAFAFTPNAPYFFTDTTFAYPDIPPMGNATIFDIDNDYVDPQVGPSTLVFFQPERFFNTLGGPRDNYIGVVDSFVVIDPNDDSNHETIVNNEGYAQIDQHWLQTDPATGTNYYEVDSIGVNLYDTDTHQFSRHMQIQPVYLKIN
jgi:hypothetical protein